MLGLDTVGADLYALAIDLGPLEIGVAACFRGRIIITAQEFAGRDHR